MLGLPLRSVLSLALLVASSSFASSARAQLDVAEVQHRNWYASHGATAVFFSAASLALLSDFEAVPGASWRNAPAFETGISKNDSPVLDAASDWTLLTTTLLPVVSLFDARSGASYPVTLLIYGETMSASLLLNTIAKKATLRARPDAHRRRTDPLPDDHYSFYSGHGALSFSAAFSGSLLHAATARDEVARSAHWGGTLALAGFTSLARVRAGRHYATDVLVGSLLGTTLGLGVPLLHGVDAIVEPADVAAGLSGLLFGTVIAGSMPPGAAQRVTSFAPRLEHTSRATVFVLSGSF